MSRFRPAAMALALLCPGAARAAQQASDTTSLPEIVVTATRYPVAADSVASTVTVLRGDDLRAEGIRFVGEALRRVPGSHLVQGGPFGAATSLFLRGGESDYVKVLVDGVPVNQPGGFFDFGSLTTDNEERIEVLRGPASVLYGSDGCRS
jgi:vitamin B12 transporter